MIDLVYAAATDAAQWPTFLEKIAHETRSEIAAILVQDLELGEAAFVSQFGSDASTFGVSYEQYYASRNVYMNAAASLMRTGFVTAGERHVRDAEAVRTEYVNDFLRPQGVLHNIGACIVRNNDRIATFTTLRRIGHPAYEDGAIHLISLVLPHVARALEVRRQLQAVEWGRSTAEAALERLRIGVIVLDRSGRVRFSNLAARAITDQADGLTVGSAGVTAARPSEDRRLRALIGVATGAVRAKTRVGGALQLSRPSGMPPLQILIAPLPGEVTLLEEERPAVMLFVSDPSAKPPAMEEVLRDLYGLTIAESRVAIRLLSGARLDAVADELQITKNTVRTHLSRVLSKTGTRSQSDLVRVLIGGPGLVRL